MNKITGNVNAANTASSPDTTFHSRDIPKYIGNYLADLVDLKKGVNQATTILEIKKKSSMAGANSWMLMCSIVIASIGLSQNSAAVIIGAMLISPLMSPILGIGLSIGINDMETLRNSLTHFGIAIIIALISSTLYFAMTPFDDFTSEIQSRTSPTFLDVMVAIFGGVAGIVSIARKDVSTTLPGVAIATALMPPLCVAGYGISQGDFDAASKSFYLFFLNSFFVALSTYCIVRLLNFPFKNYINPKTRRKNHLYVALFAIALVVPSLLIFQSVFQELQLKVSMKEFTAGCLGDKAKYYDSYDFERMPDGGVTIYLKVYGTTINENDIPTYIDCLHNYGVDNSQIEIISTTDVDFDDFNSLNEGLADIKAKLDVVQKYKLEILAQNENYKKSLIDTSLFNSIKYEIKTFVPELEELGISNMHMTDFNRTTHDLPVVFLKWNEITKELKEENEKRVLSVIKERLGIEEMELISH